MAEALELGLQLTDGTSFSFFLELDLRRDRDQMGAYVVDDLDRYFRVAIVSVGGEIASVGRL